MKLSPRKSPIIDVQEDFVVDDYVSQAQSLYELLSMNIVDGLTAGEVGVSLPSLRFPERLLPVVYLMKKHHLAEDEFPVASITGRQTSLRLKIVKSPSFPVLDSKIMEEFLSGSKLASVLKEEYNLSPSEVVDYKINADAEFAIKTSGFQGGFIVLGGNYLLQDVMSLYKFGYIWEHELEDKELNIQLSRYKSSTLTTGHDSQVVVIPNASIKQVLSPAGRQLRVASIATNPELDGMSQVRALEVLDKMQYGQTQRNNGENGNGMNIQINVLGQSNPTEVEVVEIDD